VYFAFSLKATVSTVSRIYFKLWADIQLTDDSTQWRHWYTVLGNQSEILEL